MNLVQDSTRPIYSLHRWQCTILLFKSNLLRFYLTIAPTHSEPLLLISWGSFKQASYFFPQSLTKLFFFPEISAERIFCWLPHSRHNELFAHKSARERRVRDISELDFRLKGFNVISRSSLCGLLWVKQQCVTRLRFDTCLRGGGGHRGAPKAARSYLDRPAITWRCLTLRELMLVPSIQPVDALLNDTVGIKIVIHVHNFGKHYVVSQHIQIQQHCCLQIKQSASALISTAPPYFTSTCCPWLPNVKGRYMMYSSLCVNSIKWDLIKQPPQRTAPHTPTTTDFTGFSWKNPLTDNTMCTCGI